MFKEYEDFIEAFLSNMDAADYEHIPRTELGRYNTAVNELLRMEG